MSAEWAFQVAAVAALRPAVGGVPVYDGEAPADAAFPYMVVGETVSSPWDTLDRPGQDIDLTVHVWTRAAGGSSATAECQRVLALIRTAVNRRRLEMDGFGRPLCTVAFQTSFPEPDGKTRHGVLRVRVRVRP